MFLERPLTGWGFHQMPAELPRYVSGYHERVLYPHNTYLELLVEDGVLGLVFYLWLMWEMWRLGLRRSPQRKKNRFLDRRFHRSVNFNGGVLGELALVVMSYQFVNGLLLRWRECSPLRSGGPSRADRCLSGNSVSSRRRTLRGG